MAHIAVRPTVAEDREIVLEFCKHTWNNGDYIERVWDTWLNDPQGLFLTATADDTPVGIVHIQIQTESDAWLEGLRVDPEYRGQGIGRALSESALVEGMRRGVAYVRLIVEAENTPSRHIAENVKMRTVASFALYQAKQMQETGKKRQDQEQLQIASVEDINEIIDYLNVSNIFPLTGGLYYSHYKAQPITAELLEQHVNAQQVYLLHRWERIDGLAIAEKTTEHEEKRITVGYIDGMTIEAISLIAYHLRKGLTEAGIDTVRIYAPDLVLVHDALNGMEYIPEGEIFYVYERGLS